MQRSSVRIALFGTAGPLSLGALGVVASQHTVAAVIQPAQVRYGEGQARRVLGGLTRLIGWNRAGSLGALRQRHRFPVWEARSGADPDIASRLRGLQPDIICIAGYPWILPVETLTLAPLGAINVHAALLPRHRGPLPLFWIYYHNDRQTGVTIHRAVAEADAGDILGQSSFPLKRGFPVEHLNRLNGVRGAELLAGVLRDLATGRAAGRPQDEALATQAPRIRPGSSMIDFATWDVERVWHFMAGLFPRFQEPLLTDEGAPFQYRGVRGFVREADRHPSGTVLRGSCGYDLYCHGGRVQLTAGA
ncbi:MAG: hypothetical protein E4H38_01475 [Gemmatimonadales bacterium]|nr:MAG: hypothetical protein E4H38_01475 [Gemmatimonadales bacterium]